MKTIQTESVFGRLGGIWVNVEKTIVLLLGQHRSFDIAGDSAAARLLRARGLLATHDISNGATARLPDKWHGIILGDEAAAMEAWTAQADTAVATARRLQASSLPTACRGRLAQATGRVMGKAHATLKFTVPYGQAAINAQLGRIQSAVDSLVLGSHRRPMKAAEARQPRERFGIGMPDVHAHMQAAWAKPLLDTIVCADARPYKHYYAQAARLAYPEADMGIELLSLNLSFHRVARLPAHLVTGEVRQAFVALGKLPAPTGVDNLRTYAVGRLMLHNIPHIKAYWIMVGIKTAQIALSFGVDDLDGTVQEEKIYHMAGADTPQAITRTDLVRLIREAGRHAVERTTLYDVRWEDDGAPLPDIRVESSVPFSGHAGRKSLPVLSH